MESRKYELQRQIVEALNANDDDLYSLLKSQWAHRYGVESLEELKSQDLNELYQNQTNIDNQKIDQPQEDLIVSDQPISIKDFDNQEKEIKNKELEEVKDDNDNHQTFKIKSYEIVDKANKENKAINSIKDQKIILKLKL